MADVINEISALVLSHMGLRRLIILVIVGNDDAVVNDRIVGVTILVIIVMLYLGFDNSNICNARITYVSTYDGNSKFAGIVRDSVNDD